MSRVELRRRPRVKGEEHVTRPPYQHVRFSFGESQPPDCEASEDRYVKATYALAPRVDTTLQCLGREAQCSSSFWNTFKRFVAVCTLVGVLLSHLLQMKLYYGFREGPFVRCQLFIRLEVHDTGFLTLSPPPLPQFCIDCIL